MSELVEFRTFGRMCGESFLGPSAETYTIPLHCNLVDQKLLWQDSWTNNHRGPCGYVNYLRIVEILALILNPQFKDSPFLKGHKDQHRKRGWFNDCDGIVLNIFMKYDVCSWCGPPSFAQTRPLTQLEVFCRVPTRRQILSQSSTQNMYMGVFVCVLGSFPR